MERTAKYIEILRPPNRFTMYSGRVLTLGFALVRSYLRICHLAGDENWNEDKAKKLEQNESLGKKSLCWKAEKRFNFGLKATHIKLKSSNSEAWRCTSARQTFDNTQSKVPASSTAPTYEVFAANVTCKEGSSNLGVKSIYSSLTYMRAILHIILTGSQNKCLPSIVYVILSHRHPMSSWSSLGYLQGARTCVSRPRSSLRLCPGLASSLTAIQIEHHLSWWFTLTLWMNFEKMRKNMIGVLHRGRCQGQGWSREQQRRCLLHSTRCSIPPPPSSPASESSITKISKHRLGLYFGSPVAVSESTILSVHQCEVLVQARSTSLSQRQWRCSLSWPEVVSRLCSTVYHLMRQWALILSPGEANFAPLVRLLRNSGNLCRGRSGSKASRMFVSNRLPWSGLGTTAPKGGKVAVSQPCFLPIETLLQLLLLVGVRTSLDRLKSHVSLTEQVMKTSLPHSFWIHYPCFIILHWNCDERECSLFSLANDKFTE